MQSVKRFFAWTLKASGAVLCTFGIIFLLLSPIFFFTDKRADPWAIVISIALFGGLVFLLGAGTLYWGGLVHSRLTPNISANPQQASNHKSFADIFHQWMQLGMWCSSLFSSIIFVFALIELANPDPDPRLVPLKLAIVFAVPQLAYLILKLFNNLLHPKLVGVANPVLAAENVSAPREHRPHQPFLQHPFQDLYNFLRCKSWPGNRTVRLAIIAYLVLGWLLMFCGDTFLDTADSNDTLVKLIFFIFGASTAICFALVYLNREQLKADLHRDCVAFTFVIFIGSVLLYQYIPYLNALAGTSRIEYAGQITELYKETKFFKSSSRRSAFDLLILPLELITGQYDYFVTIQDTATGKPVKFKVWHSEYDSAKKGALFRKTMRIGWLGIPYRWEWQ